MSEGYKMTELGEIPKEWDVVYLDRHINLLSGFPFKSEDFSETSNGTKLLRGVNITVGKLRWDSKIDRYWDQEFSEFEKYSVKVDDLVISMDGSLVGRNYGRVRQEDLPLLLVQRVACIRAKQSLILEYLSQIVGSPIFINYVDAVKTSSGIPHISAKNIKEFKIALPPLPEQQKIATILSTVDEKIEVIDAQITQTRELKKGLMQKLLTRGIGHTKFKDSVLGEIPESWEVVKLGRLVFKVGSGITPKGGYESYVASGVTFIRSQNVLINKLNLTDVAYISSVQHDKMNNSKVQPKDVLLNITGASIGRSCVVPDYLEEANVNQHVCIIRTNKELNPLFLTQLLNSELGSKQIDKFQAGGNREGLNFKQIRSFDIPLPSPSEQKRIVVLLSTVDGKVDILEEKKETYQQLKKGLMQQLLTGKVRVVQSELQNA